MARRLVIVVPSVRDDVTPWAPLLERLAGEPEFTDADFKTIRHGARGWHRAGSLVTVATRVRASIVEAWEAARDGSGSPPYGDVILVGHSLGGVVVRQAYLEGLGLVDETIHDEWADHVSRLVLFASMNRGLDVSRHRAWWLPMVAGTSRSLPFTRRWMANEILRGSDFVTTMRIRWIRAMAEMGANAPVVVQLLGTEDGLVRREDSTDVEQFETGRQIIIPGATHGNLIRLDVADDQAARFRLIKSAFVDANADGGVRPATVAAAVVEADDATRDGQSARPQIVLVLHGIRADNTTWVEQVKRMLEERTDGRVEVDAASYGYFSAWRFTQPTARQANLDWLQDSYTEHLAEHPDAEFHFIGHSNGTYLFGTSLSRIPSMQFSRVVLAGSVLPSNFRWDEIFRRNQFVAMQNHRANADKPVGILCAALRGLGMRDIGTGGVNGFLEWDRQVKEEVFYYQGGHSVALDRDNLGRLVDFVLGTPSGDNPALTESIGRGFKFVGRLLQGLALLLALVLVGLVVLFVLFGPLAWFFNLAIAIGAVFVLYLILDNI